MMIFHTFSSLEQEGAKVFNTYTTSINLSAFGNS
jgi:hypothetical protein